MVRKLPYYVLKELPLPIYSGALVRQRSIPTIDRRFPTKLVPTLADRGCRVVSATNPHVNFGFLDRSRYFSFQVVSQLSSRGWVDPVPDPLLLRKSGSAGNRTRDHWICSQELWPLDHRDGLRYPYAGGKYKRTGLFFCKVACAM
jgi:hypothetical protein